MDSTVSGRELRSLEAFFRRNPYFLVPWMILWAVLSASYYVPGMEEYLAARGMQPFGFAAGAKLTVWGILCSYAIHGWVTVNHDELVEKGLKIVDAPYHFQLGDASIRSTLVILVTFISYMFVPMRMVPADTWKDYFIEFYIGYSILNVVGDAWFFVVHSTMHNKHIYRYTHKMHHSWKQPNAFSAYYILSGSALIQEHMCVIPCMMFLPVPVSAFLFYEYYGVPASQYEHLGFDLDDLHIPFCGPLKLKHIMFVCGGGLSIILGGQSTAMHDHHHANFHGNYELNYSYLDRLFGTYVECTKHKNKALAESLISEQVPNKLIGA